MGSFAENYYMSIFCEHVCSVCRLCDSTSPSFCATIYKGNSDRFLEIVKYINVLRFLGKDDVLKSFYTFEGFCGLFCNSEKRCPNMRQKCGDMDQIINCYAAFANQCGGASISANAIADIWNAFSGIKINKIGQDSRLPNTNTLKWVGKKQKKLLSKKIKKIKLEMKFGMGTFSMYKGVNTTKRVRKIKTTFFCNTDKAWQKEIDSILEGKPLTNETNNRQSTKAA